ncbi:MAG TPA: hypothetical protein ENN06_00515 [Desulfobacteraceae bacterium]|nr:hypothetical protein [Desulfobacteraceae bacterium]
MKNFFSLLGTGLATVVLLLPPSPAKGFYQAEAGDYGLHLTGSLSAGLGRALYPDVPQLYEERGDTAWSGDVRLLADAFKADFLRAGLNILQFYHSTPPFSRGGEVFDARDVERSGLFFLSEHQSAKTRAGLVLDAFRLAFGGGRNELVVGRQPVSLSVTFYFSPNDFFAPFAPQSFYRVYKPGVDALRFERRLTNLSQLTVIGVLGYERDPQADSGWSRSPDWDRPSVLGRYVLDAGGFEWGALGGVVRDSPVAGASLQGELFRWLGIRAEGRYLDSRQEDRAGGLMVSVGLEHQFSGNLTVRLEQMYNEGGYSSAAHAQADLLAGTVRSDYLGRQYTAFDIGYEFTPLLRAEILHLRNWSDGSRSTSLYGVYSLSDEGELALTVTIPAGDASGNGIPPSEFGLQPVWCALVYRHYF